MIRITGYLIEGQRYKTHQEEVAQYSELDVVRQKLSGLHDNKSIFLYYTSDDGKFENQPKPKPKPKRKPTTGIQKQDKYDALYELIFNQNILAEKSLAEVAEGIGLHYSTCLTYYSRMLKFWKK